MYLRWGMLCMSLLVAAWGLLPRRRHSRRVVVNWGRLGVSVGFSAVMVWGMAAIEPRPLRRPRPPTAHVTICRFDRTTFPEHYEDFASLVRDGIGKQVKLPADTPLLRSTGHYPNLDTLELDLTNAVVPLEYDQARSRDISASNSEVYAERLTVRGQPVIYHTARMQAQLTANRVLLGIEYDKRRQPLLMLVGAHDGLLKVDVKVSEIEALLLAAGREWGTRNKVDVDSVNLRLSMPQGRTVAAEIEFKATGHLGPVKVPGAAKLKGQLAIDDQLQATLSGLTWEGNGVIGSIAGAVFEPFIQRYNGYQFPLNVFTSGDLRTNDIEVKLDDALHVTATFTAEPRKP